MIHIIDLAKIHIYMELTTVRYRKSKIKSLASILRDMQIGESLKFSANRDTIMMYIGRLNKEGRQYTGSVKGLSKDIVVTRLK